MMWMLSLAHGGPAHAAAPASVATAAAVVVCGSGTCPAGMDDPDTGGVSDWTEVTPRGDIRLADPKADADGGGVPNRGEQLVCVWSVTCSDGHEDTYGNKTVDWIDSVIYGTAGCGTGQGNYGLNGISDAAEIAGCAKIDPGFLASTRFQAGIWALTGLVFFGGGALLLYAWKKKAATASPDNIRDDGGPGAIDGDIENGITRVRSAG